MISKNLFIFMLVIIGQFVSCQSNSQDKLTVDQFETMMNKETASQIVDVRTPSEYQSGHIKNAMNMDWNGAAFKTMSNGLDKTKPVLVYCLSGGRSSSAATYFKENGYKVYELDGGMMKWNAGEKPVIVVNESKSDAFTAADFKHILHQDNLVLIDFYAPWCAPCLKMSPILDDVTKSQSKTLSYFKINVDEAKSLVQDLKVIEIPTLHIYKNKKLVWSHIGMITKEELLKNIKQFK